MPNSSSSYPDDSRQHEDNIARVVGKEQDIDKKMAGSKVFKMLLEQGRLLLSMIKDYVKGSYREVPYWAIAAGALALVYVLSPVDFILDVLPGVGLMDDAAVLAFCLKLIDSELKKYKEWKETREVEAEVQPQKA
jgi:uncharacterized membrane protein YkvA (DUF1232 family)